MKAVIYARYSRIISARRALRARYENVPECCANDITILSSYIDRALSARTADRPEFQRMIADSERGCSMWCLSGNSIVSLVIAKVTVHITKHILKKNGVRVVSAREKYFRRGRKALSRIYAGGLYRVLFRGLSGKRFSVGRRKMRLNARSNGGNIPLAIRLAQTAYWKLTLPLPHWLREIFTPVMRSGETIKAIADSLNERGLRTRKKPAIPCGIAQRHPLKQKEYIGEHKYSDTVPSKRKS